MKNFNEVCRESVAYYGAWDCSIQDLFGIVIGSKASAETTGELAGLGVRELLSMTAQDFMQYEGITWSIAERLEAVIALSKKLTDMNLPESIIIRSPEDGAKALEFLRHKEQEHFVALFLNTKKKIIGRKTIFTGSLNASIVHPREVFKEAVKRSAASIIVGHSHPSGDPTPSREDIDVTKRLVEVGKIMGIDVLDHIIIGDGKFTSLKEKGYC